MADGQPGAYRRVGVPVARQPGDLALLGRQHVPPLRGDPSHHLASGEELAPGALGERLSADPAERLMRGAQFIARVDAAVLTTQPFAVEQVRPADLPPDTGALE